MRAVVFDQQLQFRKDFPDPKPAAGSVIVDVLKAGICETDLQLCKGYMGFRGVLGHEFVGIPRSGRFAGQRVAGEINCGCGSCDFCQRGLRNHCPDRSVIGILNHDGAFADSLSVPEQNLLPIPDHLNNEQAVFIEPLAAACRIPEQVDLSSSRRVLVLGDGRLGNLCAQVLRHHGCPVMVVGKHEFKLNLLQQLNINTCHLNDMVFDRSADVVVDCTGSATGFQTALQLVQPCGTIVLKTTVAAAQNIHMAPVVIDEVRVIGSRCGPFAEAIRLLSQSAVDVEPLIGARYELEEAEQAFAHATQPDVLKVLLDISN